MENINQEIKPSTVIEQKKEINLKRLLGGEEKYILDSITKTSNLISLNNNLIIFDNKNSAVISTSTDALNYSIKKMSKNEFINDFYEDTYGYSFPIYNNTDYLGFIFIQNNENTREKIFILSKLVTSHISKIIELKKEKKELLQEILNNYREVNLLYKFSGNISSSADFNQLLKSVILESKNIINSDTYVILLLNKETGELELKASLGNSCNSASLIHPDKVLSRLVLKTGLPEIVNDVKQKQKIKDCSCNINSILAVPLKVKEEIYGVIILSSCKDNHYKARDIKLIQSLATQAAITIENTYLERSNWEHKRQLALRRMFKEEEEREYKELVGISAHLKNKIPQDPAPYLILGEYGIGKKLFARKVHTDSIRKDKPFIVIDCSLLPEDNISHKLIFGSPNPYEPKKTENDFSYAELAEGGTLFLKNVDRLSKLLGEKFSEYILNLNTDDVKLSRFNIRIAAESSIPLDKKVEKGEFDPQFFNILSKNIITIPPLRERKRDIINLAEYFVKEYSKSLGKNIKGLDDKCYPKLLSYNYRLGNVKELRQIIERACILTESDIITSEYLFLGTPSASSKISFNLLNIKPFYNLIQKGLYPRSLALVSSSFVALIFYFSFFVKNNNSTNLATFLSWSVWWPFYTISFFLLSRFWCSICPINEYGVQLRKIKHFNLKVTSFIKDNTHYFITFGFLTIIWAEEYFEMHLSAFRTGIILGTIVLLATITNIIFQRNTWCRYICPLGWFGGTLSLTSIIELRSNPDICMNKCKTHDCFKGNEKIEGCPMFIHPQFIDSNQLCKLCLKCVRLCQNNSPQLNLRFPGWDIASGDHIGKNTSLLIPCLLSSPLAIILFNSALFRSKVPLNFSIIYWSLPIIIGFFIWGINSVYYGTDRKNNFQNFYDILIFYIPLSLASNLAVVIKFIHFLSKIKITGTSSFIQNNLFSLSLLNLIQITIILTSLIFSIFFMIINFHNLKQKNEKQHIFNYINHQIFMIIYSFSFLYFILF